MTTRQIGMSLAVLVLVLILIAFGATFLPKQPVVSPSPTPTGAVACTMDARMCPDGSYVGRQGPNCEFALCPVTAATTTVPTTVSFRAKLGQKVGDAGVSITPLTVLEDSRCPVDVQCIQAGTVRLDTEITIQGVTTKEVLTLNNRLMRGTTTILLSLVEPEKNSKTTFPKSNYTFVFEVKK